MQASVNVLGAGWTEVEVGIPGFVSWSDEYYDQVEDDSLTEAQRDLLSPPNGKYRLAESGRRG